MGGHDDCSLSLVCQIPKDLNDLKAHTGIQSGSGLIGKHYLWFVCDCTGNGHALLFTAGHFLRHMGHAFLLPAATGF